MLLPTSRHENIKIGDLTDLTEVVSGELDSMASINMDEDKTIDTTDAEFLKSSI
jgi:hypothetical protein